MKAKLFLIAMLFLLIGSKSKAQETSGKTTTITATRQFAIVLHKGANVIEQAVSVTCEYVEETKEYTIKIKDPKIEDLKQNGSLSYEAFSLAFTDSFNKGKSEDDKVVIEHQSLQSIFIWLYRLGTKENDDVISGDLILNSYVKIFTKEKKNRNTIESNISDSIKNLIVVSQQNRQLKRDAILKYLKIDSLRQFLKTNTKPKINKDELPFSSPYFNNCIDSTKKYSSEELQKTLTHLDNIISNQIFYKIESIQKFELAKVITETASFQKLINEYNSSIDFINNFNKELRENGIYKIKKVTLKFERGFIEEVNIGLDVGHNQIEWYEAFMPIGFSSKYDLRNLYYTRLFPRNPFVQNNFIYLSDVIARYDVFQDLYTRDYSPADTLISDIDPDTNPIVNLKKERLVRLFETRVYTDLSGIEANSPNGLIQTEVSRRFNLMTKRIQMGGKHDIGYFNYFNIFGGLSKIENKSKRLPLENSYTIRNGSLQSPNYVTNLDLRRYENFSIGIETNLATYNLNESKMIMTLDFGARYGHIPILDSIYSYNKLTGSLSPPATSQSINTEGHTIGYYPKFTLEYLPQRRIGLSLSVYYFITNLRGNNQFKAVMSKTKSDLDDPFVERQSKQSYMTEIFARINTSSDGDNQIFFRTRLFWQYGDRNTFFPQIQLGYNYNLFFKRS